MHVSLPKELENMVKDRVESGIYGSASEVVRAAVRKFFNISDESMLDSEEAAHIRNVVRPRLTVLDDGTAVMHDFDEAFDEVEKLTFG